MNKNATEVLILPTTLLLFCTWISGAVANHSSANKLGPSKKDCSIVGVICPDTCPSDRKLLPFNVVFKGEAPEQKLTYSWRVNKGVISAGQGTPSITVDLSGTNGKGITAYVEIGDLAEECSKSFSCTTCLH